MNKSDNRAKGRINHSTDMTVGDPLRLITFFALPTLTGNLLNQVYSITDSIIVGRFLGETALAAIGVCMPIILLMGALIFGVNIGVGILTSQCFGRKDIPAMRHVLANSLYMALLISLFSFSVGTPLTVPILRLMNTPEGPLMEAAKYMRISFATAIFPMLYYLFNNAFRGMGDSLTALYCLIVSVVANVFLDILFVAVFGWGVAGSAYATALSQALSVIFSVTMLYIKYKEVRLTRADFRLDFPLLREISALAIPLALQAGFNNLGNIVVQTCINGFGQSVMAAYTAASRIGTLALIPVEGVGNAVAIYSGQNFGAKKMERIPMGAKAALILDLILSAIMGALLLIFGSQMIGLFLKDPGREVMSTAYRFLLIAAVPGILDGIMCVYQQILKGVGKPNEAVVGGFMQLGTKVALSLAGAFLLKNTDVIWLAWPLSFAAGTIYPYIVYRRLVRS